MCSFIYKCSFFFWFYLSLSLFLSFRSEVFHVLHSSTMNLPPFSPWTPQTFPRRALKSAMALQVTKSGEWPWQLVTLQLHELMISRFYPTLANIIWYININIYMVQRRPPPPPLWMGHGPPPPVVVGLWWGSACFWCCWLSLVSSASPPPVDVWMGHGGGGGAGSMYINIYVYMNISICICIWWNGYVHIIICIYTYIFIHM